MAKKVSIEFNLKIPRNGDATFSISVPVTELAESNETSDVNGVASFVKRKLALGDDGLFQLKVLNGREVIAAWKTAKSTSKG